MKILIEESVLKQALEALEVATTPLNKDRQEILSAKTNLRAAIKVMEDAEPIFWYRPCCDGEMYEGPKHNRQMEDVRKSSGVWVPLFAHPAPAVPDNTQCAAQSADTKSPE